MTETTKIVYAFDPVTKLYTGSVQLDESDKCQIEGVWHIPGNCLEVVPPEYREGEYLVAVGDHWEARVFRESEPVDDPIVEPVPAITEAPEPTRGMRVDSLAVEIQKQLDAMARAHGYSTIESAVSYAEEISVPKYYGEGRGFRRLRSQAWAKFYELVAGDGELPSLESMYPQLPVLDSVFVTAETAAAQASIDAIAAHANAAQTASDAPAVPAKRTKRTKA